MTDPATILSPAQLEAIRERTARECKAQGIPFTVEDPSVLAKIARLCAGAERDAVGASGEASRRGLVDPGGDSSVTGDAA